LVLLLELPLLLLPNPSKRPPWVLVVRNHVSTVRSSRAAWRSVSPCRLISGGWTMRELVPVGLTDVFGSPTMAPGRPKVMALTVPVCTPAASCAWVAPGLSPRRQ
jgi:hypothetical protein